MSLHGRIAAGIVGLTVGQHPKIRKVADDIKDWIDENILGKKFKHHKGIWYAGYASKYRGKTTEWFIEVSFELSSLDLITVSQLTPKILEFLELNDYTEYTIRNNFWDLDNISIGIDRFENGKDFERVKEESELVLKTEKLKKGGLNQLPKGTSQTRLG